MNFVPWFCDVCAVLQLFVRFNVQCRFLTSVHNVDLRLQSFQCLIKTRHVHRPLGRIIIGSIDIWTIKCTYSYLDWYSNGWWLSKRISVENRRTSLLSTPSHPCGLSLRFIHFLKVSPTPLLACGNTLINHHTCWLIVSVDWQSFLQIAPIMKLQCLQERWQISLYLSKRPWTCTFTVFGVVVLPLYNSL